VANTTKTAFYSNVIIVIELQYSKNLYQELATEQVCEPVQSLRIFRSSFLYQLNKDRTCMEIVSVRLSACLSVV
jgi:hypothetical protein